MHREQVTAAIRSLARAAPPSIPILLCNYVLLVTASSVEQVMPTNYIGRDGAVGAACSCGHSCSALHHQAQVSGRGQEQHM